MKRVWRWNLSVLDVIENERWLNYFRPLVSRRSYQDLILTSALFTHRTANILDKVVFDTPVSDHIKRNVEGDEK